VTGSLTLMAAFVLGLAASGHCVAMCGGVSGALGLATARSAGNRPRATLLIGYQVGRVVSYAIAGGLAGGMLGFVVGWIDVDALRSVLHALAAAALVVAALVAFGVLRDPGARLGRVVWPRLAPLAKRLLPVTNLPRALAFGMVWGWMPCGFAYTVMLIAALEHDALRAAATMIAFGLGTAPAMLAVGFGAPRAFAWAGNAHGRRIAGSVLVGCAAITLFAPQIVHAAPWLQPWMPFLCRVGP
jgi:hypothetical protein